MLNLHPASRFCARTRQIVINILVGSIGLFLMPVGFAETIEVPIGQQGKNLNIKLPRSGMKQSQVEAEYGRPLNSTSPVGEPPISSWIYADFVVYFEYDHVVHAVVIHKPQTESTTQ